MGLKKGFVVQKTELRKKGVNGSWNIGLYWAGRVVFLIPSVAWAPGSTLLLLTIKIMKIYFELSFVVSSSSWVCVCVGLEVRDLVRAVGGVTPLPLDSILKLTHLWGQDYGIGTLGIGKIA
jgi:hypothetical protein